MSVEQILLVGLDLGHFHSLGESALPKTETAQVAVDICTKFS